MEQTQDPQTQRDPTDASPSVKDRQPWLTRPLRWAWVAFRSTLQFLLVAWGTLAVYYSNLPWAPLRVVLAVAFAALGVWALWVTRRQRMGWAFVAAFAGVVVWFMSIRPSNDRPWRPEVAVTPRAVVAGDHVRIDGVRNFDFRSATDFTPRYEQREFSLAHVSSVDLFISYWVPGPVAHTFLSFNFDDGTPPLCVSIETRPEVGEEFAPIASMFKQVELIYVVGDEHDIVGLRTNHRGEDVYLYPVRASPAGARRLLEVYLSRINELADHPEFYHLLKNSCTVNIVRYAVAAGRPKPFDLRQWLNGWVDLYLYETGAVDTILPFAELRRRSRITDAAKAAGEGPDFSRRIRASLPRAEERYGSPGRPDGDRAGAAE
jgi:hypothetical protein